MKQPKLRFPEFTEDWIPYKLNNICEKITDGSHHSPSEVKNGYPMPSVKNMLPNGFDIENSKKISKHDYELLCSQGCKPEIGDVVVAKDGSVLKYAFEIKKSEPIVILSSIAIMKPNHSILDGGFLAQSITVPHFKERIIAENTTGTGVPRIVLANFKNIFISLPKIEEQQKIASLFTELDILIQSAEKELEGYRELKQGMLQKMFPKKGEKVPEIRFLADDGSQFPEWEEKKIDDVATCFAGATPSTKIPEYWKDGTIRWMSSGEVNNGQIHDTEKRISQLGFDKCSTKMVKPNTVVMALAGQGKTRGMVAITRVPLCTNQSLCAIETNDDICDDYLYQYLQIQYNNLRLISSGDGTRGGLNLKLIGGYIVSVPCLEEQKKIGEYFQNLDNLIASQQQELEGYKELKKGLLQQMFC